MDNLDPGGNKKNKKKKKQRGQGLEGQAYPEAQFENGPYNGGFVSQGVGGPGMERGGIGYRGAFLGRKPLPGMPAGKGPHPILEEFGLPLFQVSMAGGTRTVMPVQPSVNPHQGHMNRPQGQGGRPQGQNPGQGGRPQGQSPGQGGRPQGQNPGQGGRPQGQGQGHPEMVKLGLERQESNPKNAGGKGKAKGGNQTKDQGQQKGGGQEKKDGGSGQKGTGNKSFKGKLRNENYEIVLRELASHRIFELRKRNLSFPNAKFFCRLCEYHLDRVEDCERHMDENRHQRKKEASDSEAILRHIPDPTPSQIAAINGMLKEVVRQFGLTPADLEVRRDIVERLQKLVLQSQTADNNEVNLRLYGSSLSGLGLKDSDVNVEVSGTGPGPKLLMKMYRTLTSQGGNDFTEVQSDFQAKVPVVRMNDTKTGLRVVVAINAQSSVHTSTLLQLYCVADPRVKPLTVALRSWAKICHLDRQEEGTLPPFSLGLMVVFFLLQIKPSVVCLLKKPKTNESEDKEKEKETPTKEEFLDIEYLTMKAKQWQSKNGMSVGELWVRLLQFYCLKFDHTHYIVSIRQQHLMTRQEKRWHSKKLAIEDPFTPKKNLASSMGNTLIFEYFQSSLRKAYNYFGLPRDAEGGSLICIDTLKQLARKRTDELLKENQEDPNKTKEGSEGKGDGSKHPESAAKDGGEKTESEDGSDCESAVIQPNKSIKERLKGAVGSSCSNDSLLETTVSDCDLTSDSAVTTYDAAISASDSRFESEADISTSGVDTAASEVETAVSEGNITTDSLAVLSGKHDTETKTDVKSANLPQDTDSKDKNKSASKDSASFDLTSDASPQVKDNISEESSTSASDEQLVDFARRYVLKIMENAVIQLQLLDYLQRSEHARDESLTDLSAGQPHPDSMSETTQTDSGHGSENKMEKNEAFANEGEGDEVQSAGCSGEVDSALNSTSCFYKFTEEIFTGGKGPAVICGYCEKEGHIKANCPDDKLPSVEPLPPMSRTHLELLDRLIQQVVRDFAPSEQQIHSRKGVVREMEHFVKEIYPGASFSLFGSSCNGFGFFNSDLDICMTLDGKILADTDVPETIEAVASRLLHKRGLYNVISIPTAKVPIVKFTDRSTKLEGDISLYNILAQRNTKLLKCYSQIDPRVRQLGYAVKVFAKTCDIGDASRGSLSSYGYILMMIHYLQQCRPPVVPILQELPADRERPEVIVEGCNTYFFEDMNNLPRVWSGFQKNRQSPGELWLGFLRYYLEVFDWKGWVVTIRQSAPLTKFEKLWNGQTIAVEDPFDLSHNLGGGLSRKMNNYIYKTFVNGRMHFGTPVELRLEFFRRFRGPEDYFFNMSILSDGKPPNDRGCRLCGKIGHMVKDCPQRRGKKGNQQNQQKENPKENSKEKEKEGEQKQETRNQEDKNPNQLAGNAAKKEKAKAQGSGQTQGKDATQSKDVPKQDGGQTPANKKGAQKGKASTPASGSSNTAHPTTTTTTTNTPSTPISGSTTANRPPPGFRATPPRNAHNTPTNAQPVTSPTSAPPGLQRKTSGLSPGPQGQGSPRSPAPKTPQQGMHPPGVAMDVQQLFSLVQQFGGNITNLAPQQPPTKGSPAQGFLSPEQQVAAWQGHGPISGGGEGVFQTGSSLASNQQTTGQNPDSGFTNLMALFANQPQSQQKQNQQQPPRHSSSQQQRQHPQQHHQQYQQHQQQKPQQAQQQHLAYLLQQQQALQQQIGSIMQLMLQPEAPPVISQQLRLLMQQHEVLQQQINAFAPPAATPATSSSSQGKEWSMAKPQPREGQSSSSGRPMFGHIPVSGSPFTFGQAPVSSSQQPAFSPTSNSGQSALSPNNSGQRAFSQSPNSGQPAGSHNPNRGQPAFSFSGQSTFNPNSSNSGQPGSQPPPGIPHPGMFGASHSGPWVFGQRSGRGSQSPTDHGQRPGRGSQSPTDHSPGVSVPSSPFSQPSFPQGPHFFQMGTSGLQGHQAGMSPHPNLESSSSNTRKGSLQ